MLEELHEHKHCFTINATQHCHPAIEFRIKYSIIFHFEILLIDHRPNPDPRGGTCYVGVPEMCHFPEYTFARKF